MFRKTGLICSCGCEEFFIQYYKVTSTFQSLADGPVLPDFVSCCRCEKKSRGKVTVIYPLENAKLREMGVIERGQGIKFQAALTAMRTAVYETQSYLETRSISTRA